MTRPPFPEVIDSTIRAAATSCMQKAFLEFLLHYKPKEPSVHLHAGSAYAAGQERVRRAFYMEGESAEDALAQGLGAVLQHYGSFDCPDDSAKSASRTAGALEFYYEKYPLGVDDAVPITLPGGGRGIEFSFAEPLMELPHPETGNPIIYCGRMDMICEKNRLVLIEDDKTTSQLGASWPRQWDLRCFSDHHELYTQHGWMPIQQVTANTELLQSDAEGNFSFTTPTDISSYQYTGEMLSVEGRRLSQFITPNHRVLLQRRRGGTTTVLAESLFKQDGKNAIPLAGRHTGDRLPDDFQRLLAMVQADAKLQPSNGRVSSGQGHREHMPNRSITLGFIKERKLLRCQELLDRLAVKYTTSSKGFYISGFERVAELTDMVLDEHKEFKAGYETLFGDAFLDELEYWDGWNNQYYTNSRHNALFVSTVAALNDRAASAGCDEAGHWTVVLSHDTARTLTSTTITAKPYVGRVYCVSVPASYVLTRLAGNISISGNSQFTGYKWGASKAAGIHIDGVLIRGVSILKTKYDHMEAITYRPDWQVERWYHQLLRDIRRMIACWEEGYWDYNLDHACTEYGGCLFRNVCLAKEPEQILAQLYSRRAWNPITREETLIT